MSDDIHSKRYSPYAQISDEIYYFLTEEHSFFSPPEYVYHYTGIEGLRGIIEKKAIWLSHWKCLNDISEIEHGVDMFIEAFKACDHSYSKRDQLTEMLLRPIELFMHGSADVTYGLDQYISSFSKQKNSLDQWRSYCPDRGYSIGLPSKLLQRKGILLNSCMYSDDLKKEVCEKVITKFFDMAEKTGFTTTGDFLCAVSSIHSLIMILSGYFKNEHFKNEEEVRFSCAAEAAIQSGHKVEYRSRNSVLVPYFEIPFNLDEQNSPLDGLRITVSPPARPHAKEMLEHYLESQGCTNFKVDMSDAPYADNLS